MLHLCLKESTDADGLAVLLDASPLLPVWNNLRHGVVALESGTCPEGNWVRVRGGVRSGVGVGDKFCLLMTPITLTLIRPCPKPEPPDRNRKPEPQPSS